MEQFQTMNLAMLIVGLKKSLWKSGEDLANLPQISLQNHAEAYKGGGGTQSIERILKLYYV